MLDRAQAIIGRRHEYSAMIMLLLCVTGGCIGDRIEHGIQEMTIHISDVASAKRSKAGLHVRCDSMAEATESFTNESTWGTYISNVDGILIMRFNGTGIYGGASREAIGPTRIHSDFLTRQPARFEVRGDGFVDIFDGVIEDGVRIQGARVAIQIIDIGKAELTKSAS